MYTNIHAADSVSKLRCSPSKHLKNIYPSDWNICNSINFNDVGLSHESFEFRFNFNCQSTLDDKRNLNFEEFGYYQLGSDFDSCSNVFEQTVSQKTDSYSTLKQINSYSKQADSVKESETEEKLLPTSTTNSKFAFDSELDQLCELINSSKTNLNKFLDDLIFMTSNEPPTQKTSQPLELSKSNSKRMRKSVYQTTILSEEYNKNSIWSKEDMISIGNKSGLKQYQVYKWYWEQRKKSGIPQSW